jgi:hypothetical protein
MLSSYVHSVNRRFMCYIESWRRLTGRFQDPPYKREFPTGTVFDSPSLRQTPSHHVIPLVRPDREAVTEFFFSPVVQFPPSPEKRRRSRMFFVRRFVSILALTTILFASLSAQTPQSQPTQPSPQQQKSQPKCTDNGTYQNSKGETVKRPENCTTPPEGATAQCRDGSYSFSQSRRGTCSHHGGVAKWL